MDEKRKMNMDNKPFRVIDGDAGNDFTGNSRNKKYGMRKVNKTSQTNKRTDIRIVDSSRSNPVTDSDVRRKIEKQRKQERLKKQRIRALAGLVFAVVLTIVLLFMTPIFNVREIRLNGNNIVSKEVINDKIGYSVGSNLFGLSVSKLEKKMLEIPQISDVSISKNVFPPYLTVNITEGRPAAYLISGSNVLIIDSDLKIIDDSSVFDNAKLPSISGISVSDYKLNETLNIKSTEKMSALKTMLKTFEDTGITNSVTYISLDDLTAIKFNYSNRIEVLCGSQLELDRKIRMFTEAIKTSSIPENSIGTMDVSVPGQGIYDP